MTDTTTVKKARKPLSELPILKQVEKLDNLLLNCGNIERQRKILELVGMAIDDRQ